jgi:hypothetical protein
MRDVKEDEEITISYCDMIHDIPLRTWELKHYGFACSCPACSGDGNDETSFAFKSAGRRFRLGEVERETRFFRGMLDPPENDQRRMGLIETSMNGL